MEEVQQQDEEEAAVEQSMCEGKAETMRDEQGFKNASPGRQTTLHSAVEEAVVDFAKALARKRRTNLTEEILSEAHHLPQRINCENAEAFADYLLAHSRRKEVAAGSAVKVPNGPS